MSKRAISAALSRREFVATTTAVALSPFAVRAETGREDLADHIHPDVRIVRDELAKNDNAFWSWKEAAGRLTSLHGFSAEYFREDVKESDAFSDEIDFADAVDKAEEPAAPFPQREAAECVRAWLEASKQPISFVEQGIAKDRFQVPQENLVDFLDNADALDDVVMPREVARLKTVQCGFYLNSGQEARAAKTIADLLNMARMALSGDGFLVHYLVAMGVHNLALDAVNAVAFHPATNHDSLDDIRRLLLKSRPQADSLARVFRIEVVHFTQHEIARLPSADNLPQFIDELIKRHLLLGGDEPDAVFSNEEQVARVRKGLLKLFDGHPKPFDAANTIRLYSGVIATMIDDLHSPWLARKKDLTKPWLAEIRSWPEPLSFINDFSFSFAGHEKEKREVTDKEIAVARKALLRVENPVG